MIRLILDLAYNIHGQRLHGKFTTHLDGRQLCVSHQPLLDGARFGMQPPFSALRDELKASMIRQTRHSPL